MSMDPLYETPPQRTVYLGPLLTFNQVVCLPGIGLYKFLYTILEIKLFLHVSLANMFSHIAGSLFILMMVSLAVQKLFNLMQSHFFIFSFISLALRDTQAKILLCEISEILPPMFSSRIFYGIMTYLSLLSILSSLCKLVVQFLSFAYYSPVLPTPFIEEAIFTPFYALVPLIDHRNMGLFCGSLFCSTDPCVCSYASTRLF